MQQAFIKVQISPILSYVTGTLNVAEITDFIDGGGNVMIGASSDVSELLRELAAEVGGMQLKKVVGLIRLATSFLDDRSVICNSYNNLIYERKIYHYLLRLYFV